MGCAPKSMQHIDSNYVVA